MTGTSFGLAGDIFRGATPIGFRVPVALSLSSVMDGMRANPTAASFTLKVNPYSVNIAESIAGSFEIPVKVVSEPKFAKDAWLLTPE